MNATSLIGIVAAIGLLGAVYAFTENKSPLPRIAIALAVLAFILALDLPWIWTAIILCGLPVAWFALRMLNGWLGGGGMWDEVRDDKEADFDLELAALYAQALNEERRRRDSGQAGRRRPSMGRKAALDALGLDEGATEQDIRRAHRDLMKAHHPDRGGSTAMAAQLNRAREQLLGE